MTRRSAARAARPELDELVVADPPDLWQRLGFTVIDGVVTLGGIRIRLGAAGAGIVGWSVRGIDAGADLDGLPAVRPDGAGPVPTGDRDGDHQPARAADIDHPNGAIAVDHVVALTPDFERTVAKLRAAGFDYRRTRDAGEGLRQAFFVVGRCLLELGGPASGDVRLWGLTLVVEDLDATAALLGDRIGRIKDAVQPGRRIATVTPAAGLSVPVALMTPRC